MGQLQQTSDSDAKVLREPSLGPLDPSDQLPLNQVIKGVDTGPMLSKLRGKYFFRSQNHKSMLRTQLFQDLLEKLTFMLPKYT